MYALVFGRLKDGDTHQKRLWLEPCLSGGSSKEREGYDGNRLYPHRRDVAEACISPPLDRKWVILQGLCPAGLPARVHCQQSGAEGGDYEQAMAGGQ